VPEIRREILASAKRGVKTVASKKELEKIEGWDVQRPRVYYRREPPQEPLILMRKGGR
jgi:hypothetical protein